MLSMSEQAARLRPAPMAKDSNRPFLSPRLAGIPLIMLSAARRPCLTKRSGAKTQPRPAQAGGPLGQVLTTGEAGDKGAECRFGGNSCRFHRYLAGNGG